MAENSLYYGDNLDILRRYIKDESVDLIYLDPPFKSAQDYNILFAEKNGSLSKSQIKAFEDTWQWSQEAEAVYQEVVLKGDRVSEIMQAFRRFLGTNDMMAYLVMMAPRLAELHRVLKPTGSIYLHCDPTASHYLKLLMDTIFDPTNFRNEIIWRRTGAHSKLRRYAPIHDMILFYTKTKDYVWNYYKKPYMSGHIEKFFVKDGKGYKTNYYGNVLTGSGIRHGESGKSWRGFDPTAKGRHWAIPKAVLNDIDEDLSGLTLHQKLDRLLELGYIKIKPNQSLPLYERYLKHGEGQSIPDIWAYQPYTEDTVFGTDKGIDEDVRWLSTQDQERQGYPTQKPEGILERIIRCSCPKNGIVLDPFCGCGTTIVAAHRLNKHWIGIDITYLAITLIKGRLQDAFGEQIKNEYDVIGEPVSLPDAKALAEQDRFQFQWWALGLVGARPVEQKKGADMGIDGRIYFFDKPSKKPSRIGTPKQIIFSVKSGNVNVSDVRDLRGVIEREKVAIGVLITLTPPTKPMQTEAISAGFYEFSGVEKEHYPRIQILTIAELLNGETVKCPPFVSRGGNVTFEKAPKVKIEDEKQKKQTTL